MNKNLLLFSLLMVFTLTVSADGIAGRQQRLFETVNPQVPYRIPAIAQAKDGTLIAVSDYRYCGADIGYGAVDLHYRLSNDNGKTWGEELKLADGTGIENENGATWDYAFGDCAIAADRQSNEMIALCVCGKTIYSRATRQNPNRVARFRSHDGGRTWDKGEQITDQIYALFDNRKEGPVNSLFVGSGKIFQSRQVKVNRYYRLYAALCTLSGNFVIYSDDFGDTWQVLGDIDLSPARDGDEPKCEELPDGSVILSSRYSGRLYNIFTYTDIQKAEGQWEQRAAAQDMSVVKNACNGEIMLVPAVRKSDKKRVWVALQSIPFGPGRTNVGLYFHELSDKHESAANFAANWTKGLQLSTIESAYSTFILQHDYRFGFLWEEGPAWYHIDYRSLTMEEITNGLYTLDRKRAKRSEWK